MTDSNAHGQPGDPGEPGKTGEPGRNDDLLAGLAAAGQGSGQGSSDQPDQPDQPGAPRRVIGTPPPAEARTVLAGHAEPEQEEATERWLPADPQDKVVASKAEKIVAACFILALLAGLGFIAAYVIFQVHTVNRVVHSNLALGATMALTFLLLGVGATIWVRHVMPKVEYTEERHLMRSSPQDRAEFKKDFDEGAEASGFVKRPLIRRTLIAATVPAVVAPIVLLRDLGPLPRKSLDHTVWRKGMRLIVYGTNRPITPAEFSSPGGMITVAPDGFQNDFDAMAKAAVIIIKMRPGQLQAPTVLNWTVDDIVAYSKICTHVGCPAALYEQTTHHILCPCHQSTFDATRGAEVIFGPATRALPQLPITTDSDGFLVAQSDFHEPVGPSYWERS
jgi:ubiquinol-cytochrome c reductase iron-sulfur subunit